MDEESSFTPSTQMLGKMTGHVIDGRRGGKHLLQGFLIHEETMGIHNLNQYLYDAYHTVHAHRAQVNLVQKC